MLKKPVRIAIGTAAISSAVIAPIALIAIPMALTEKFVVDFYESGASLASLNHVIRGGTANSNIYGFFMEGLFKANLSIAVEPVVDSVDEMRGPQKHQFITGGNVIEKEKTKHNSVNMYLADQDDIIFDHETGDPDSGITNVDTPEVLKSETGAKMTSAMGDIVVQNLGSKKDKFVNVRIQEDAKWSNGVKIDADDFVQTIKYILDRQNAAVTKQVLVETMHLRGVKEIVKLQEATSAGPGLSFDQAWSKVEAEGNAPVETLGTNKRWVSYHFTNEVATIGHLVNFMGGNLFMPINKEFVDSIGGILRYGQTKETTLANGPFKISQMDLDYQVTFSRNEYYYQKDVVFLEHPAYKVAPSQAIAMQLFKDGKLSSMTIPNELLQSFYSDPKLASLVAHGSSMPMTSGVQFSKYYGDTHSGSPIKDKNFRKAIMYAINRKDYAIFKNASGSSPASSFFTPRKETLVHGAKGQSFYDSLIDLRYKEKNPITGIEKESAFESYDKKTKRSSYFGLNHNNEYNDEVFDAKLANDFLKKYFEDNHKSSVTLKVMMTAVEEDSFLALQSVIKSTFHGLVKLEPELVAGQIMQERMYSGDYQMVFSSKTSDKDDLWTFYSKLLMEDGYDDSGHGYKDINGKSSMEATSRVVSIPGFVLGEYIKTLSPDELSRLHLDSRTAAALKEAMIHKDPKKLGEKPTYKYGVQTLLMSVTSDEIPGFGLNKLSPYQGTDASHDAEKIYKTNEDLFGFFGDVEKLMRDSAYFIPLLNSSAGFFADRRGLRSGGNSQGLPYGYQFVYPKDNNALIDKIEAEVLAKTKKNIVLERLS